MKPITIFEIDHFELELIMFAAKWQLQDWNKQTENELYTETIKKINTMKEYTRKTECTKYYIYSDIFKLS